MITRCVLAGYLVVLAGSAATAAEKLTLDKKKSKIEFVGAKTDGKHTGGFKKFDATAVGYFKDPANGELEIVIETASLFSDNPKLTNHLKNPDFFDVRKHPQIKFSSKKIIPPESGQKGMVSGPLTMLGKPVEVKVPVTHSVSENVFTIKAEFQIDRTKWGMTYGEGKIDNDVAITAVLVFNR